MKVKAAMGSIQKEGLKQHVVEAGDRENKERVRL